MDNNNEERNNVMVSNLPLLFSDGKPTSVASMSVVCYNCTGWVVNNSIFRFFVGGSSVLYSLSHEVHTPVWAIGMGETSQVQMVACRCAVVSNHPHQKTSNTSKLFYYYYYLLYFVFPTNELFSRYGKQSCRELWGVVMITMDVATSSSFRPSCTKWLGPSSLKITGMEQLPCLIVILESSWSHSGMKTWYIFFNVFLSWKELIFSQYLITELWYWFEATEQPTYNAFA